MTLTRQHAAAMMPRPSGKRTVIKSHGITRDIQDAIVREMRMTSGQGRRVGAALKGATPQETVRNIHQWIRNRIPYQIDKPGEQVIMTPAVVVNRGKSDCKGYAILCNSLLEGAGIPSFPRFTARSGPIAKHVYQVAQLPTGERIPIDPMLPRAGMEPPGHKVVTDMTQISRIAGFLESANLDPLIEEAAKHPGPATMTQGELMLQIQRERMELERNIFGVAALDEDIQILRHAERVARTSPGELDRLALDVSIDGIGFFRRKKNKTSSKTNSAPKKGLGRFIQKAGNAIKSGAKAVAKVATAPARGVANLALRALLPGVAGNFLYLFLPANLEGKLPDAVRRKRAKQQKVARFITEGIGIKEDVFIGIIRNGIMKSFGQTPEQILAQYTRGISSINGIGAAQFAALIPLLGELIKKIAGAFKKKGSPAISAEDAPDPTSDFAGIVDQGVKVAMDVAAKLNAPPGATATRVQKGGSQPGPGSNTGDFNGNLDNIQNPDRGQNGDNGDKEEKNMTPLLLVAALGILAMTAK